METVKIRSYKAEDVPAMADIWNQVVEEGTAFPQESKLTPSDAAVFFASQTYCAVAAGTESEKIYGLYILHPNNIGRCGHISNASYAVDKTSRGLHIGEQLVRDCIRQAGAHGFRLLQFNAVVADNIHARHLYERIGFHLLGTIPGGFRKDDRNFADICLYYIEV